MHRCIHDPLLLDVVIMAVAAGSAGSQGKLAGENGAAHLRHVIIIPAHGRCDLFNSELLHQVADAAGGEGCGVVRGGGTVLNDEMPGIWISYPSP